MIRQNEYSSLADYKKVLNSIGIADDRIKKELKKKYDKNSDNELVCGFGDAILQDCLSFIFSNNVDFKISDFQEKDWKNISRKIWSLGCAMKPKRS